MRLCAQRARARPRPARAAERPPAAAPSPSPSPSCSPALLPPQLLLLATAIALALFIFLILRASGQADLAQYDPYAVRARVRAARAGAARRLCASPAFRPPSASAAAAAAQILGVSSSASDAAIKKAYRGLARMYHPDTPGTGDAAMFQAVKKAYDALTDEVIAENYRLYGNPDGRQAMEVSIGLPNFLKGGLGWLFVAAWLVLLGGVLPYVMYGMYVKNKDRDRGSGLHNMSLQWLTLRLSTWPDGTRVELLPEIVGACTDFCGPEFGPAQPPADTLDAKILAALAAKVAADKALPSTISPGTQTKNCPLVDPAFVRRNMLLLLQHCCRDRVAGMPALTTNLLRLQLAMLARLNKITNIMVQMAFELESSSEYRAMQPGGGGARNIVRYWDHVLAIVHFQQLVRAPATEAEEPGQRGAHARIFLCIAAAACHARAPPPRSLAPLPPFVAFPTRRQRRACGRATVTCGKSFPRRPWSRCTPRAARSRRRWRRTWRSRPRSGRRRRATRSAPRRRAWPPTCPSWR